MAWSARSWRPRGCRITEFGVPVGQNLVAISEPDNILLRSSERRQLAMANETRTRADTESLILSGEPALEYQPVVDLTSGRLLGFEALLRWHHPDEGLILPGLLIPWLEANGDIVQLGEWVLREGCRQATHWPKNIQLAVNLSMIQLRRGVGTRAVSEAIAYSGIEPGRLTVEVTEHAMVDEVAMSDLRAIGALGVELAVDDVGTSWTSFDVLRRMAVNIVKIDRSFVGSLEPQQGINRLVVETVVSLAHSAGISTVAEGVETSQQAAIVREFECDAAQGYFFAPPLSVEMATQLANEPGFCFSFEGAGWTEHHFVGFKSQEPILHEPYRG
jgi:EAL domain-containing protein (putative c-di-GMP-specific phosphodiesterase class I)